MAITPAEAAQITSEELAKADEMERLFDETIRERCTAGIQNVYVSVAGSVTERIRNEVMRRYREAGWQVRYECDQRDGCSLIFTPAPASPGGYRE